jgi:hypothetical protein
VSENSGRPDWAAMSPAEFDAEAPDMLPVSVVSARVVAVCDTYGTTALFGEEPRPAPAPRRPRPPAPGDVDGQGTLF